MCETPGTCSGQRGGTLDSVSLKLWSAKEHSHNMLRAVMGAGWQELTVPIPDEKVGELLGASAGALGVDLCPEGSTGTVASWSLASYGSAKMASAWVRASAPAAFCSLSRLRQHVPGHRARLALQVGVLRLQVARLQ